MTNALHPFRLERSGRVFLVRPISPGDKALLQRGFTELSAESKYFRFFAYQRRLSDAQLRYFTEVDGVDHVAWGILDVTRAEAVPVAVGRFIRLAESRETAEVAFTVVDAYQQQGLGGILLAVLNLAASAAGVQVFRYYVLSGNGFVLRNLEAMGTLRKSSEGEVILVDARVYSSHREVPDVPELRGFSASMREVEGLIGKAPS